MLDDSIGATWHELSEVVARLVDLEARMDRIDPPAPPQEGAPDGHE